MSKIAIIGAGAAGLMAAARIAELGGEHEVFLIERNKILGKKVIISGGGRCNVTTGLEDLKILMTKYPRGSRFLRTAMYAFPPTAMREWMEEHGVPLKVEPDLRVFPKSDNGAHVVRAFERFLEKTGVKIMKECGVAALEKKGDRFLLQFENGKSMEVDNVILSPGGQAYRHTGSKGDGYSFAESMGHSITPLGPSLNAFLLKDAWTKELSGLSFPDVNLSFKGADKFSFRGPIMLTHKGVTGPAVFALSAYASYETFNSQAPAGLFIDFLPDENHDALRERIQKQCAENPKKNFQNVLARLVPRSFAEGLCFHLGINGEKNSLELSKKELNKLVDALKNLPFLVSGRSAGDEFVTAGGVELKEVDSKTMESKICPGLYFAGEILDYDGFTGGFNLQAAWATGRLAGEHSSA
jgi:predicted Rossmann fold flavoprotein